MMLCFIKVYLKPFQHQAVLRKRVRATEHVAVRKKGRTRLIKRVRKRRCVPLGCEILGRVS